MNTTETFETFPARPGHVRAALYNLRHRRAERMPAHIALRAESLLCDLGDRLENGETCILGSLESFLLDGARNWTHYAASACHCAEVCQETIIRDFYEHSPESAEFYVRKMYGPGLENDFCVKLESAMLGRAFRVAEDFMRAQFEEYKAVREVRETKEAVRNAEAPKTVFWAFNNKQFAEGLKESGLDKSEILRGPAGMYGSKDGILSFLRAIDTASEKLKECEPDALFAYEFSNHECGYTRDWTAASVATRETFPNYCPSEELLQYLLYADNEEFTPSINR